MSLFIYVMVDIIHLIKIILLCDMFFMFEKRERKHKNIVLPIEVAIISTISMITYICNDEFIVMLISMATVIVLLCVLYRERILSMVISAIWISFNVSMIDIMSTVLVDVTADLFGLADKDFVRLGAVIISLLFVFIVGKIYNRKYDKGIKAIGTINLVLFTFLAVVDAFIVLVMAYITANEIPEKSKVICTIAFILVIFGMFIQLGAVILLFMQRNLYKEKKQITEKYLDEQKNHYEYLEKRELETKKFRHDLRNHMQMLSNLANNRQHHKIDDYLDAINVKIESFGDVVTVQNGIVDAIINQYYSRAMQYGIKMQVKGIFPRDCSVEAYDLCTIFSNVLSNALEAAVEAEDKKINLECRYNSKNIIIVVSNTFKDVGQFENNKIKTRKDDIDYHGYGLTNIRESIEKYNGVLDIETKKGEFTLSIMLNYVEKRDYEDCGRR